MRPLMKSYVLKSLWVLAVLLPLYGCGQGGEDSHDSASTPRQSNSWASTSQGAISQGAARLFRAVWIPTTEGINNAPTARYLHTAVWSGTTGEMIVWGGYSGSSYLNTGGRYNPTTDSWLTTSTGANVPAARYYHTSVWARHGDDRMGGVLRPPDQHRREIQPINRYMDSHLNRR